MVGIIVKGSPYVGGKRSDNWQKQKDSLHKRRIELAEKIKVGIMSKAEMNRGNEGEPEFDARVQRYSRWANDKDKDIREFQNINREFKKHGEEGRPISLDHLRPDGEKLKFE